MEGDAVDLPEREREVLRLLLHGHDAKRIARACGLSVNTVNERLRTARRKLGVTSSREAARLLGASEAESPDFLGSKKIGVEAVPVPRSEWAVPDGRAAGGHRPAVLSRLGPAMLAIAVIGVAALATQQNGNSASPQPPSRQPRVKAASPAPGGQVAPGPLTLRVTFDRPMRRGSYSFVQTSADTYPDCGANAPELSRDRRTFTLRCKVGPGRAYEIWFNRPPYMNFKSEGALPAVPFQLRFRTGER